MGIFGKLKNIFYDEEVVEVPEEDDKVVETKKPKVEEIKIETVKEEPKPTVRQEAKEPIKTETTFTERELFRPEKTFDFTEFDDEEEEVKPRVNVMDLERNSRNNRSVNFSAEKTTQEGPKVFKPSPVISPIYGILDKDYKREEIRERSISSSSKQTDQKNYDAVRKKAYGSLEDTLSDTLVTVSSTEINAVVKDIDEDIDKLEKTKELESLINEIEKNAELTVGQLEDKASEEIFNEEDTDEIKLDTKPIEIEDKDKTMTDNTLEHDLFNLIDSMYDDKEE